MDRVKLQRTLWIDGVRFCSREFLVCVLDICQLNFGNSAPIPLIDSSTPLPARMLKSAQDIGYGLVFSDEFTRKGMLFGAGIILSFLS